MSALLSLATQLICSGILLGSNNTSIFMVDLFIQILLTVADGFFIKVGKDKVFAVVFTLIYRHILLCVAKVTG